MQKITDKKLISALEHIAYKYLQEKSQRKDFRVEIVAIRIYTRVIKDNHRFPVWIDLGVENTH